MDGVDGTRAGRGATRLVSCPRGSKQANLLYTQRCPSSRDSELDMFHLRDCALMIRRWVTGVVRCSWDTGGLKTWFRSFNEHKGRGVFGDQLNRVVDNGREGSRDGRDADEDIM